MNGINFQLPGELKHFLEKDASNEMDAIGRITTTTNAIEQGRITTKEQIDAILETVSPFMSGFGHASAEMENVVRDMYDTARTKGILQ